MTEFTAKIAACGPETEDIRSGEHVEAWLLLDRIDMHCRGSAIDQIIQAAIHVFFIATETSLPFAQDAATETDLTLSPVSWQSLVKHCLTQRAFVLFCPGHLCP